MRLEMLLWGGLVLYYVVLGAIYWAVDGDPAGATLLLMATALGGLVAGWIWDWRRHHAHPRAEDQVDGDASDATGVVGVFPSASIRPLALAVGATDDRARSRDRVVDAARRRRHHRPPRSSC